jgi:hypothetical protein
MQRPGTAPGRFVFGVSFWPFGFCGYFLTSSFLALSHFDA